MLWLLALLEARSSQNGSCLCSTLSTVRGMTSLHLGRCRKVSCLIFFPTFQKRKRTGPQPTKKNRPPQAVALALGLCRHSPELLLAPADQVQIAGQL